MCQLSRSIEEIRRREMRYGDGVQKAVIGKYMHFEIERTNPWVWMVTQGSGVRVSCCRDSCISSNGDRQAESARQTPSSSCYQPQSVAVEPSLSPEIFQNCGLHCLSRSCRGWCVSSHVWKSVIPRLYVRSLHENGTEPINLDPNRNHGERHWTMASVPGTVCFRRRHRA